MCKVVIACALVAVMYVVVHAQPQNAQMQQMQKLQTAMADAQTKAVRPGDAAMSCEALQSELQAAVLDPEVQKVAQENGAVAKEKIDELEKGSAEAKAAAATRPVLGAERIAKFMLGYAGRMHWSESDFQLVTINGAPGLLLRHPLAGDSTYSFDIADGRIRAIYVVRNPDKLRGFLERTH